jgi:hypothetical protein
LATILVGFYMVRYPLGGMLSGSVQWLVALRRLGHDVYVAEKAGWPNACYDPVRDVMTDDCSYGAEVVDALLRRFGLEDRWCFVDAHGRYHGLSRRRIERVFRNAALFVDMGTHGAWLDEASSAGVRVLIDGEPGWTQMRMEKRLSAGEDVPVYDAYYTVGRNVGTSTCTAPTAGRAWRPIYHPVVVDLFAPNGAPKPSAPFTTVMNWQSHEALEFDGRTYGQKDVEFERFIELPTLTSAALEVAVSGRNVPSKRLSRAGWRLRDAHAATLSYDSFCEYIRSSRGEFSVAKNVFVATNSGWFSDRSAAYLASGRPAVLQDTGFSAHLPCGEGLIAVGTLEEAADALERIERDHRRHSAVARTIACEHLEAERVLAGLLQEVGL